MCRLKTKQNTKALFLSTLFYDTVSSGLCISDYIRIRRLVFEINNIRSNEVAVDYVCKVLYYVTFF